MEVTHYYYNNSDLVIKASVLTELLVDVRIFNNLSNSLTVTFVKNSVLLIPRDSVPIQSTQ
jgi:hypothetical protein